MKFTEYVFFAALLTPTAAVLVAAAISFAGSETTSQAFEPETVVQYALSREFEEQP